MFGLESSKTNVCFGNIEKYVSTYKGKVILRIKNSDEIKNTTVFKDVIYVDNIS